MEMTDVRENTASQVQRCKLDYPSVEFTYICLENPLLLVYIGTSWYLQRFFRNKKNTTGQFFEVGSVLIY